MAVHSCRHLQALVSCHGSRFSLLQFTLERQCRFSSTHLDLDGQQRGGAGGVEGAGDDQNDEGSQRDEPRQQAQVTEVRLVV